MCGGKDYSKVLLRFGKTLGLMSSSCLPLGKSMNTWTSPQTKCYIEEENIIFFINQWSWQSFFYWWNLANWWFLILIFSQNNNGFGGFISPYFEQMFIKWPIFYIRFQWETNYIKEPLYIYIITLINTLVLLVANFTLGLGIMDFWKKFWIL
jgi:hypothetical protein